MPPTFTNALRGLLYLTEGPAANDFMGEPEDMRHIGWLTTRRSFAAVVIHRGSGNRIMFHRSRVAKTRLTT